MKKKIKISIRSLVEFILRHGDIDNRYVGSVKAIEGIKGHQIVQKSYQLHWAQGICYGYIYSIQNELENIDIQITYYNIESKTTRIQ